MFVEHFKLKLQEHKFKKNVELVSVPQHVTFYYRNQDIANHYLFNKKWNLKFKSTYYFKLFLIYWESVLRKMNYYEIYIKNS